MDLPYEKKFTVLPNNINLDILVDYFNLEFALEDSEKFDTSSFDCIGLYTVNEHERVYWKVKGTEFYAVAKPFDGNYIIEMEPFPCNAIKIC